MLGTEHAVVKRKQPEAYPWLHEAYSLGDKQTLNKSNVKLHL